MSFIVSLYLNENRIIMRYKIPPIKLMKYKLDHKKFWQSMEELEHSDTTFENQKETSTSKFCLVDFYNTAQI